MKLVDGARDWGLCKEIVQNLEKSGIEEFFPVQKAVIPLLLFSNVYSCIIPHDVCVSAPTGSGKTLSYAVPIIQTLLDSQSPSSSVNSFGIKRLKALIILPNRELAYQVHNVMQKYAVWTETESSHVELLKVGLAVGGYRSTENEDFVASSNMTSSDVIHRLYSNESLHTVGGCGQHSSKIDVLVCTPGRLLFHLENTVGFTLAHLQYLVLDEADRLLGNASHYWIKTLMSDQAASTGAVSEVTAGGQRRHKMQRLLFSATLSDDPSKLALLGIRNPTIIHVGQSSKQDTGAIAGAEGDAADVSEEDIHQVLSLKLKEYTCVTDTSQKPFVLTQLVYDATHGVPVPTSESEAESVSESQLSTVSRCCAEVGSLCLIFVSSIDTGNRLFHLLDLLNAQGPDGSRLFGGKIAYLSSTSNLLSADSEASGDNSGSVSSKQHVMDLIQKQQSSSGNTGVNGTESIKILIATDQIARGIDIPNVALVINYDPPTMINTYVHRVGRTARANKSGVCCTLLKSGGQVGTFRKMRSKINRAQESKKRKLDGTAASASASSNSVVESSKYNPHQGLQTALQPMYKKALKGLHAAMAQASGSSA